MSLSYIIIQNRTVYGSSAGWTYLFNVFRMETGAWTNWRYRDVYSCTGSVIDPDSIELAYEDENHKLRIGELLNKQAEIYEALGVALPTLSC